MKAPTSIGKLRYRVDLQSGTESSDGAGGCTVAHKTIAQIYADIRPSGGSEQYRQGKIQEKVTHKIFIRFREEIDSSWRIQYEGRTFQIKNIINVQERDRFLQLLCEEGVAA